MEISATPMTIDQRMNYGKESRLFYKVFTLASAGMFLDAADVYMASAINTQIVAEKFATTMQSSYFLSAGFLGLFIGAIISGYIGDFYGRKRSYQINLFIFGVFTLIASLAPNIYVLMACRFFAAVGLGAEIVTGYAVVNEFAPVQRRGHWTGMTSLIGNTAAPITLVIATFMIHHFGWRSMFIVVGIAALILWVARHNFPESPRWLMSQGREKEATAIVEEMNQHGYYDEPEVSQEERESHTSFMRGVIVASIAVSAVCLCQYTFTTWVPTLLMRSGSSVVSSIGFSAIMMLGAPVGGFIGTMTVDHVGRKKMIVGSFIASAILGITYAHQSSTMGILINGFLITVTFYILMAVAVSVYNNELFDTAHRFRGAGIAHGISKALNALMPTAVAFAIMHVSPNYIYYAIAILAIFAAFVVAFFGPETARKEIR
ncbi:MFS transporter [Lacticaseibacillus sp. GG6-2]